MSLNWIGQDDFSVGWLSGVGQDQLPGVGLARAYNCIFDDDGDCYRRGAIQQLVSMSPFQIQFIWSGWLGNVYRGLVASTTKFYAMDAGWGIPTDLGAPGLARAVKPAVVSDLLFMPGGWTWGGSSKANYATGTIALTAGSPLVTGVGTAWGAGNAEAGMLFQRTGGTIHRIKSVDSATQLTLDTPALTTVAAGAAYTISAVSTIGPTYPAVLPAGNRHLGAIYNRLVAASGNIVVFSKAGDPWTYDPTDYHKLPDGVNIVALATIRDTLLIFTDSGLWSITGMAFDLTDDLGNPQQQVNRLTPEISLIHESGLADWAGALVVPCTDRVFLVDGLAPPVPISDSIQSLYANQLASQYTIGGAAVYRNHYFLPWVAANGNPPYFGSTLFVCRLNRPVRSRQVYYGWSLWTRKGAGQTAYAADTRNVPILRAAGGTSGYVLDFTETFQPFDATDVALKNQVADYGQVATSTSQIEFDVIIRDVPTGNGQPNHVRRMRVGYEAIGNGNVKAAYAYSTEPTTYQQARDRNVDYAALKANYATYAVLLTGVGSGQSEWSTPDGRGWTVLDPVAAQTGVEPIEWDFPRAERVRYIAGRVRVTDPLTTFKLRKLQFAIRPATHQR
jgi:hypothetical protein